MRLLSAGPHGEGRPAVHDDAAVRRDASALIRAVDAALLAGPYLLATLAHVISELSPAGRGDR